MGLCMAREAKAPANKTGVQGGVIYCSAEAHMSIAKAAALLGLGHDAVRLIPVDEAFRMRTEDLRRQITQDLHNGKLPIAVVASAGTTATGSIDPLSTIADICQEFGLWLHIDGAYGALASLAIPDAFRGLERADSLSLDPHKWLYQPTGCGCLLYRTQPQRSAPFRTPENMPAHSPTIPSRGLLSSKNQWSFHDPSALSSSGCPCATTGFMHFRTQSAKTFGWRKCSPIRLTLSLNWNGLLPSLSAQSAFDTSAEERIATHSIGRSWIAWCDVAESIFQMHQSAASLPCEHAS